MKHIALWIIAIYQKYISPKKGYSCAHRILNNGQSCSSYCSENLKKHGFVSTVVVMPSRFRQCYKAGIELSEHKKTPRRDRKPGEDTEKACFIAEILSYACCFAFN